MMPLKQYSNIKLKRAMPDLGLPAGITGTIIEIFDELEGYEIEFDDPQAAITYTLKREDIEPY